MTGKRLLFIILGAATGAIVTVVILGLLGVGGASVGRRGRRAASWAA